MSYKLSSEVFDLGTHLLNVRTGDTYEIDENGRRALSAIGTGQIDQEDEVISFMLSEKLLVDPEKKSGSDFFHLQWHLLNDCNLRCRHCYDYKQKVDTLTFEQMLNVVDAYVDFIKKLEFNGEISLTGGEPLLFPRLPELIDYIKSRDIYIAVYVLSNGTLEFSDPILENFKKNSVGVQVSLDGTEKIHEEIRGRGSYAKSLANIKLLRANGIPAAVHCVIMKRNAGTLRDLVLELEGIGIKDIHFSNLVPIGPGEKEEMLGPDEFKSVIESLSALQKEVGIKILANRPVWTTVAEVSGICPVGYKTITIDAEGRFMPCRRLPLIIGDAKRDSFFKVWYTSDFLCKMREREKYLEICGKCEKASECGGCRAIAKAVLGDPFAHDPSCWLAHSLKH